MYAFNTGFLNRALGLIAFALVVSGCKNEVYEPKGFDGPLHEFILGEWHITAVKGWPYGIDYWTQVDWDKTYIFYWDSTGILMGGPEIKSFAYEVEDGTGRLYFLPKDYLSVYQKVEMLFDHVMILSMQTRDGPYDEKYIRVR
ncbi:MAG: hypothetical protein H6561_13385 [Lewinellaceae bacterium]|nr:hypothetical protein [Lewinellaceae bacterium]